MKDQINEKIEKKTRGFTNFELYIEDYGHDDLTGIKFPTSDKNLSINLTFFGTAIKSFGSIDGVTEFILPSSITEFACIFTNITDFKGLVLFDSLTSKSSLREFICSHNQITSFEDLKLPDSLFTFSCDNNNITSFTGLKLPDSLVTFNCDNNNITSFTDLILPSSLKYFDCSYNQITSFVGLTFLPTLIRFRCYNNLISDLGDSFPEGLPASLIDFSIDVNVILTNPKFNCALLSENRLGNPISLSDLNNQVSRQNIIFLYFNIKSDYLTYDQLITGIIDRV